ncbi:hypothetical protein [Actinomadura rifamycini]|uniref:hypothetical protein n=1 Tax=Actinomadura rifamycini TaxID=31962 RepID=UPI0003FEB0CF|nr:hypothetical protein [Actinomadura rifamycini]
MKGETAVYEYGLTLGPADESGRNGSGRDGSARDGDERDGGAARPRRRTVPGLDGRRPPKVPPAILAASFGKGGGEDAGKDGDEGGNGDGPAKGAAKPADAGSGARARGPRVRLALRIVPAAALVAVSAALGVVWQDKSELAREAELRRDLASAAGKVADTFFNWDHRRMDESFAAKYPLLTEKAADAIRPTAASLTSYFTKNKVSSEARIHGIYPGEIEDGAANVLVVINTKVTTAETVQSNNGATVALSMEHASGRWLAGNITLLSPGAESVTDENGEPLPGGDGAEGAEGEQGADGSAGSGLPGGLPSTGRP